uniref:TEA domain transcription factor 3 n=1 Tax=Paramormyrops kingsleyae TaxID=1676925 RepID=A0A3B3QT43_9TELE
IASNEWNANGSPEGALEEGSDEMDKAMDGDAEGVWSPDIEQSFQEALAIYPPCGRRKIILSDEGKMYGRNELIARYIKLRTGKTRTRKQVSSHLQVLARRKSREMQSKLKDQASKDKALQSMAALSSAQIVSPGMTKTPLPPMPQSPYPPPSRVSPPLDPIIKPFSQTPYLQGPVPTPIPSEYVSYHMNPHQRRALFLSVEASVPDGLGNACHPQADLSGGDVQDGPGSFYGVSSQYSSSDNMTITVSTKVCSFGKQVVEKVETEFARVEGGRCVYRIHRSPMCEYMINFIHKLKHLPEKYMMNSVLENFTILQVVTNRDTQETLLCIAFVFEVSASEHGAQYHVYRLMKD